jgi:low affinity Fe/Cu permease
VIVSQQGKARMLVIAVILVLLWALGYLTAYTMGGLIHLLLVIAIIVVLMRVIQGKKALG